MTPVSCADNCVAPQSSTKKSRGIVFHVPCIAVLRCSGRRRQTVCAISTAESSREMGETLPSVQLPWIGRAAHGRPLRNPVYHAEGPSRTTARGCELSGWLTRRCVSIHTSGRVILARRHDVGVRWTELLPGFHSVLDIRATLQRTKGREVAQLGSDVSSASRAFGDAAYEISAASEGRSLARHFRVKPCYLLRAFLTTTGYERRRYVHSLLC